LRTIEKMERPKKHSSERGGKKGQGASTPTERNTDGQRVGKSRPSGPEKPFHGPEKKLSKKLKRDLEKGKVAAQPVERKKRIYKGGKAAGQEVVAIDGPTELRLNQFIARAGVCSRREADELIANGLIKVNGKVAKELGLRVSLTDNVEYNGKQLQGERMVYVLLNKPKGFITTTEDDKERKTVMELIESACEERIYPVGRLDRATLGLLLFTNDGKLAEVLTHPANKVRKIYHVFLNRPMPLEDLEKVAAGIELEDGFIKPDRINYVVEAPNGDELGIQIHSGRNRIVRRIFEHLGYEVLKLDRTLFAGLTKKDLPRGKWRFLTDKEVAMLKMHGATESKKEKPQSKKTRK
jgi:23S rRNA pseudouridine2605 synthase